MMRFLRKLVRGPSSACNTSGPQLYHSNDIAVALLALFAFRHYGYNAWPQGEWAIVYGLSGALCLLALLWLVPVWWPVKAWAMGEELLTAGCSAAWLAWPEWFTHAVADERCSQALGFKIGSVGLVCLALVTYGVNCTPNQLTKHNGRSDNE